MLLQVIGVVFTLIIGFVGGALFTLKKNPPIGLGTLEDKELRYQIRGIFWRKDI